jgi:hypothetical protein
MLSIMNNIQFGAPKLVEEPFPVISGSTGKTMIGLDVFARGKDPRFFDLRETDVDVADAYIQKMRADRKLLHVIPVFRG